MLTSLLLLTRVGASPVEKTLKALNPLNSFHVMPKYSFFKLAVKSMMFQFTKYILSINMSNTGHILEKIQASTRRVS